MARACVRGPRRGSPAGVLDPPVNHAQDARAATKPLEQAALTLALSLPIVSNFAQVVHRRGPSSINGDLDAES